MKGIFVNGCPEEEHRKLNNVMTNLIFDSTRSKSASGSLNKEQLKSLLIKVNEL